MLLSLYPVPGARAEGAGGDQVLDASEWSDACWGGLTPTITQESGGIKVSVTDENTGSEWRSTAIKKGLSNINGVGKVTLQYSADGNNDLAFSAQLAGNDKSGSWKQYSADGEIDNGTVTFSMFKVDGTVTDLSAYAPSQLVIQIGSNSQLPSEITLSNITITAPESGGDDSGYKVNLTLSESNQKISNNASESIFSLADKASVFNSQMVTSGGKFRLTFSSAVNGEVNLVYQDASWGSWKTVSKNAAGATVEFTYDDLTSGWGTDFSTLAHIKVENKSDGEITVTKLEWLGNTEFSSGDDDSGYKVKLTLSEQSKTIVNNASDSVFSFADKASVFNSQMITAGGKFRLTFSGAVNGDIELVYQDKDWGNWKGVTKTASGTALEFTYEELTASWGTDLSALAHIKVNNKSSNSITVTKLEWLGNTEFSSVDDDSSYVAKVELYSGSHALSSNLDVGMDSVKSKFVPQMITVGGKFRLTFADGATGNVKLSFGSNEDSWPWYYVEKTINNGKIEVSYDEFKQAWGSRDISRLYQISAVRDSGDSVTVTKLEWLGNTKYEDVSGGGGEDPDPGPDPTPGGELTRDENGVVTVPNNQGDGLDFTGYITPGGYFRVEYMLKEGVTDAGIQLTMEPSWVAVSEASLDKDGKSRKGNVSGNTYYAEFTYTDCEKAWQAEGKHPNEKLNTIKKVFPQYSWNGPDSDAFKAAIASYTVKYYPTDAKAAHELTDSVAVVGSAISAKDTGASYQWYRVVGNATAKGTAISSATGKSYIPTEADKGCWLYCVIDNQITAGPAAVVVSKTNKTTEVFSGSKEVVGGNTTDLWTPASTESTFNKAMIVPGGFFRMKCDTPNTDVKLVLKEPWTEITGKIDGGYLVFDYAAITGQWKQNFANIGEIDVKNTGSSAVTITSLEWTGYDIGVEEAPYMPTDYLPYGGTAWEKDWLTKTVTQDTEKNLLTATVAYDGGEWSVARMKTHSDTGFIVGDNNMVSLNVYIEKAAMDAGKGEMLFQIVDCSSEYKLNTSEEDAENIVTVGGKVYYRTPLNMSVSAFPARFNDFVLAIRGKNSTFDGTILVDNITLRKNEEEKSITVPENDKAFTNGSATVNVSKGTASAYYGDTIKVAVKLENKPTSPVKVTITLNDDRKTESSKDIPVDQFTQAGTRARMARAISGGWTAEAEVPVPCTVGEVKKIEVKIAGHSGNAELAGLTIVSKGDITQPEGGGGSGDGGGGGKLKPITLPYTWEFISRMFNPWKYEPGWNSDYSGSAQVSYEDGRMRVDVNYSKDGDKSWSQMAVTLWHNEGMLIKNATHVYMDLYYVPEKLDGSLAVKLYSGGAGIDVEGSIKWDKPETRKIDGIIYNKVRVEFDFPPVKASEVHDMALCLIGRNTTYRGSLFIEGLTIEEEFAGSFVMSKHRVKDKNSTLRTWQNTLVTSSDEKVDLPKQVTLVDGEATAAVRSVYAYLQAIGGSKNVLFGQQYNFGQKAGSSDLSDSDTYDIVKDYAAVYGLDALALTGTEFSADRCNRLYGTPFPSTAEGNVVAAAYLTNTAIKRGAIVTLSCHMPNFSQVKAITPNCSASYARYDFSGYTPNVLTGGTANEILPGGKYNDMFNAYLDMIADYANRVNGAVLFRPFHENTGSWFWWGKDFCSAQTYQDIYRYTVEYLRDEKGVHNLLYVYGPGSEAESLEDYAERYPGDSYVDMVGFDMYDRDPDVDSDWMDAFKKELTLVSQFAANHGKLVAVTETGAANDTVEGDDQTALLRTGNKDKDWFRRVLDVVSDSPASYLLVWANFGQTNGFYTPYVIRTEGRQLYGHEMMDNFIDYYNDPRSVFASDQKSVLNAIHAPTAKAVSRFKDVPAGVWYSGAVEYVAQNELMSGVGGGLFKPGTSMTRAMMAQVLYNMEGRPEVSAQRAFQDVADSAWYAPAIKWAVSNKIATGYNSTRFGPEDKITREQMTVMLYNYAKMKKYDISSDTDVNTYADAKNISSWALEAVRWATGKGLLTGIGNNTLAPESSATRAQLASILMRYSEKIAQ